MRNSRETFEDWGRPARGAAVEVGKPRLHRCIECGRLFEWGYMSTLGDPYPFSIGSLSAISLFNSCWCHDPRVCTRSRQSRRFPGAILGRSAVAATMTEFTGVSCGLIYRVVSL